MDIKADVVIVGSGIAGMYSALNLREDLNIVIITKSKVKECNTYLAQGGISTIRDEEDKEVFIDDTLRAGSYKNNVQALKILADESKNNIEKLVSLGVKFDMDREDFDYTKEGAHSTNRIVHSADVTGKKVFDVLLKNINFRKNIRIYENTCMIDIIASNNKCYGVTALQNREIINIYSKVTILACGGVGGLFKNSTNVRDLTGDGIASALRNNIEVENLNFIQFHPTALFEDNLNGKRFLISESLRGEGAYIINNKGKRFINELLPRDVVSKAILEEVKKTDSKCVYLDTSHMSRDFIINRFPGIYKGCLERGVNILKEKIPVLPVQHYFMGGIKADIDSKTSMENLFACGEVSCTGIHGANRLASNSLLEGLVFSKRAAEAINEDIENKHIKYVKRNMNVNEANKRIKLNKRMVIEQIIKSRKEIKYELVYH